MNNEEWSKMGPAEINHDSLWTMAAYRLRFKKDAPLSCQPDDYPNPPAPVAISLLAQAAGMP
jgi:hypothetical protein